jgi:hypothetical protein
MPFFHELFAGHPAYAVLVVLQAALTIWMIVDCRNRGQDHTWFWVILWLQPFGAWAYFFAVKLGDLRGRQAVPGTSWLASLFERRASLDELRYKAEHVPTLTNRLALAERLIEKGAHAEAIPLLESALKTEPDHGQVLYSLALCQVRLGWADQAFPPLERLLARDPRWHNYDAWRLLVEARVVYKDGAGALAACRELARLAPTLENHCLLAEHLLAQGQAGEARLLLERSLRDHDFAPGPIRRRNRSWAAEARRLLKGIPSS